jgi:hypothetical protein
VNSGETEVAQAILARLDALVVALEEDADALGALPADMVSYRAMGRSQRVASRALLKSVEQMEDQLARFFRLVPKLMLTDTVGWFAQDYANFAEKLGVVEDSFAWTAIVRLRNRLVHDYPLQPEAQLELLSQAHAAMPLLVNTARAARSFVENEGLLS